VCVYKYPSTAVVPLCISCTWLALDRVCVCVYIYNDNCFSFTTTFHNNNKYITTFIRLSDIEHCACVLCSIFILLLLLLLLLLSSSRVPGVINIRSGGPSSNKTDVYDAMYFVLFIVPSDFRTRFTYQIYNTLLCIRYVNVCEVFTFSLAHTHPRLCACVSSLSLSLLFMRITKVYSVSITTVHNIITEPDCPIDNR